MTGRGLAAAVMIVLAAPAAASAAPALNIDVISSRADLISAGDALVAIDVPDGVDPATITVTEDGRDVTQAFAQRENGRFEGLVTGLDADDERDRRAGLRRRVRDVARRVVRVVVVQLPVERRLVLVPVGRGRVALRVL